jgi:hypothetical protein
VSSNANNEMDLQLVSKSSTCKSVIVCSKNISSQCKVTAQIEQVQDKYKQQITYRNVHKKIVGLFTLYMIYSQ